MAFTGLEDRFNANVSKLYNYRTTRDRGDGSLNDQPFIVETPINYRKLSDDTRFFPVQSTILDTQRLGAFLKSPEGRLFLLNQAVQQTGDAFVETRILNPLFIIGNAVPYLHIGRPLANASDFTPSGDQSQKSPGSDALIGAAGRMQQNTADAATANAMNTGGTSGLLSLLNPAQILQNINSVFSLITGGATGINARPEFDVGNGTMYSVALWEGFQKDPFLSSPLQTAAANLRTGNIIGAAETIAQGISNLFTGTSTSPLQNLTPPSGRDTTSEWADGRRYFITDADNADRYLKDSIVFGTGPEGKTVPVVNMPFMNRAPYTTLSSPVDSLNSLASAQSLASTLLSNPAALANISPTSNFNTQTGFSSFLNSQISAVQGFVSNAVKSVKFPINVGGSNPFTNPIAPVIPSTAPGTDQSSDNPAEDDMLFPDLALRNRYQNDARLSDLRTALQAQMAKQFDYWKGVKAEFPKGTGFIGGSGLIGQPNNPDPRVRTSVISNLQDELNTFDPVAFHKGTDKDTQIPADYINALQQQYGQDFVNVFFYDYINHVTIPFRAFVTNISENVTPEMSDTRYIGRLERNVVYVGVSRQLNFTLKVYAMSLYNEMPYVWKKINYMTGLCYPAAYDHGFMVPPLVKLTLGDFYRDQPGYIRSLTHVIEEDTSWEITPGLQVPQGITMNISFAVLEKMQMQTGATFYPFGEPRDAQLFAPNAIGDNSVNGLPTAIPASITNPFPNQNTGNG